MLKEQVEQSKVITKKSFSWIKLAVGIIGLLLGLLALVCLITIQPQLTFYYSVEQLGSGSLSNGKADGFFPPEVDSVGNLYVWTQGQASLVIDHRPEKPLQLTFQMRSATVAGGKNEPIEVWANNQKIGQLLPDPQIQDFQLLSLKYNPKASNAPNQQTLQIELRSQTFRPSINDNRALGTMLQSIKLDRSEDWLPISKRQWLYGALPLLALLAASLFWLCRLRKLAWAGYGAILVCFTGAVFMALALFILFWRVNPAQKESAHLVWLIATFYLAGLFVAAGLALPWGVNGQTTLYLPISTFIRNRSDNLSLLWVSGLALLLFFLVTTWFDLKPKDYDWVQYITIGTLFPFLIMVLWLVARFVPFGAVIIYFAKLLLLNYAIFVVVQFVFDRKEFQILILLLTSAVQLIIVNNFTQLLPLPTRKTEWPKLVYWYAISFVVIVFSWSVAMLYFRGTPFDVWIFATNYRLLVFILLLLLVCLVLYQWRSSLVAPFKFFASSNAVAVLMIFAIQFRHDGLLDAYAYHHFGVFVGAARMVQQGGWLLWDVPSQYGFLNILLLAWLPGQNTWQSLYLLNSGLNALISCLIFFTLRSLRNDYLGWILGLFVALAVFFKTELDFGNVLVGDQLYPAAGGIRYIWVFVLLGILFWEFKTKPLFGKHYKFYFIGSAAWVLGTLWAAESAAYSAAVWLPAFLLMVLRNSITGYLQQRNLLKFFIALSWILLPFGLLVAGVALLIVYYNLTLGHSPDFQAFFDYVLVQGVFAYPMDYKGWVWFPIGLLCLVAAINASLLRKAFSHPGLSLSLGLFGATWIITSIFVARSYTGVGAALMPMYGIVVVLALHLLKDYWRSERWAALLYLSLVPVLTVIAASPLTNQDGLINMLNSPQGNYSEITTRMPAISEPALINFFKQTEINPTDPIVIIEPGANILPPFVNPITNKPMAEISNTWLPTYPFALLLPLSDERKQVYMERYIARHNQAGWLIEFYPRPINYKTDWFFKALNKAYIPTRGRLMDAWNAVWYEPKSVLTDPAKARFPVNYLSNPEKLNVYFVTNRQPIPKQWFYYENDALTLTNVDERVKVDYIKNIEDLPFDKLQASNTIVLTFSQGVAINITQQARAISASLQSGVATTYDFVERAVTDGKVNSLQKVDTPSGLGSSFVTIPDNGLTFSTLALASGFNFRYENIKVKDNTTLIFNAGVTYKAGISDRTRLYVEIRSGQQQQRIYQIDLSPPVQLGVDWKINLISLKAYAGQEISVIWGVEAPEGTTSNNVSVAFKDARLIAP